MNPGTDLEEGTIRPFASILRDIGGGAVADDAASKLAELVRSVLATGRKGRLTLTVDVEAMKNTSDVLIAKARVVTKNPDEDPTTAIFYATDAGSLVRDNPRQSSLFPRPTVVAQPDVYLEGTGTV